ncbi:SNW domain-containing protein 1-like protein, partial [Leptotrombidium deliense]
MAVSALKLNLPMPNHSVADRIDDRSNVSQHVKVSSKKKIPPYGQRKGWVPRNLDDFGDGGAFPEIHCVQ